MLLIWTTHLDDVTMEMKEEVQGDLLSRQRVQAGQARVLSSYLQQLEPALTCGRQEARLAEMGTFTTLSNVRGEETATEPQRLRRISTG